MSNLSIKKAIDSCCDIALKRQNVVGVAKGTRIANNIDTKEECITIFVSKKVSKDQLSKNDIIPGQVYNIKTDVVEIGEIKPAGLTSKIRPVEPGYCISPYDAAYSGTAGCIVADKNKKYILSNNHVLADTNTKAINTKIVQPSVVYGGNTDDDVIALLSDYVKIEFISGDNYPRNLMDAAIAEIINENEITNSIALIGQVSGINIIPKVGDIVKKAGMTSEKTYGGILYTDAIVSIDYDENKAAIFEHQILTTGMISPGDSGSLILDNNNYAVALGFAGSETVSVATPINYILKEFGVVIL